MHHWSRLILRAAPVAAVASVTLSSSFCSNNANNDLVKYKLTSLHNRGRGEQVRIMLAHVGVPYEDVRLTPIQFRDQKNAGKLLFDTVPVLTERGDGPDFEVTSANAINRYLAKQFGLYGSNNREAALIDACSDACYELRTEYERIHKQPEPEIKTMLSNQFYNTLLPRWLRHFELILNQSGGEFLVGNKMSLADIVVFDLLDHLHRGYFGCCAVNKTMNDYRKRVTMMPGIKEYLQQRPKTLF